MKLGGPSSNLERTGTSFRRKGAYEGPVHKTSTLSRSSVAVLYLSLMSAKAHSARFRQAMQAHFEVAPCIVIRTETSIPQPGGEGIDLSFRHCRPLLTASNLSDVSLRSYHQSGAARAILRNAFLGILRLYSLR